MVQNLYYLFFPHNKVAKGAIWVFILMDWKLAKKEAKLGCRWTEKDAVEQIQSAQNAMKLK